MRGEKKESHAKVAFDKLRQRTVAELLVELAETEATGKIISRRDGEQERSAGLLSRVDVVITGVASYRQTPHPV